MREAGYVVRASEPDTPVIEEQILEVAGCTKRESACWDEEAAAPKVEVFGIELLDIRFKRINYNESVRPKIYERMISERRQIAERFRSEGNGEAARINGNRERELNRIRSEAYREVAEIRGEADAMATEIYAAAYNKTPEAADFYEFQKTMDMYKSVLKDNSTLIMSTSSEAFEYLKSMNPAGNKSSDE